MFKQMQRARFLACGRLAFGVVALMVAAGACSSTSGRTANVSTDPADGGAVCPPVDATACPDPPPHYADVAGILQQRCVPCHYDQPDGPWPLENYRQVADWQDVVRDDLLLCTMPPADGGVTMTEDERLAIITWLRCGYLE